MLLRYGLRGFLTGYASEDDDVGVGVGAEAVRAVRDARHLARGPETFNRLAVRVQDLSLRIDLQTAHRVVNGRNTAVNPVGPRREVFEFAAIVEVEVLPGLRVGRDLFDSVFQGVKRNLEMVGNVLQGFTLVEDARPTEDRDLVLVVLYGVRAIFDLLVEKGVAVLTGLRENRRVRALRQSVDLPD